MGKNRQGAPGGARMPFAVWNPELGDWESPQLDLFAQRARFGETWPTSGMTRGGLAYRLPRWERLITGSGCSRSPGALLRTPLASDSIRGRETLAKVKARKGTIALTHQVMELVARGSDPTEGEVAFALAGTLFDVGDLTPGPSPGGSGSLAGPPRPRPS
ncbi:MAG: hypothetical protein LBC97_04140 [Bifidobacteriaceae bacterium]|jgi:hypothetical protein|nr:hypothetical protein [Bifidobacteriaceae bacterium]